MFKKRLPFFDTCLDISLTFLLISLYMRMCVKRAQKLWQLHCNAIQVNLLHTLFNSALQHVLVFTMKCFVLRLPSSLRSVCKNIKEIDMYMHM